MDARHQIIVTAENNPYMVWQSQLFHYSCVSRLRHTPVIFVHATPDDWHPGFGEIIRAGGMVCAAPSYRFTRCGDVYLPRNSPGTLLEAAGIFEGKDTVLVLCDADMIFAREASFPGVLAAEGVGYLNYDRPDVRLAARRLGVPWKLLRARMQNLSCAVPHVIPVAHARRLAEHWLEAVDAFTLEHWDISMYAFGLAVASLGLDLALTRQVTRNVYPLKRLEAEIIHYSSWETTAGWSKRQYRKEKQLSQVWEPQVNAPRGSILREILKQVVEAGGFYRAKTRW